MALRKGNFLPQFKVASYECLGIRISFKDPTTLLPGGGVEERIGRLRSLEKMPPPPKYAIFSTVLSKIVACTSPQVISTSPRPFLISRVDRNRSVIWISQKNSTYPLGKLRSKITSPITKSTTPGLFGHDFLYTLDQCIFSRVIILLILITFVCW